MRISIKGRSRVVNAVQLAHMMGINYRWDAEDWEVDNAVAVRICSPDLCVTKRGVHFEVEEYGDVPECPLCYKIMRKVRNEPGLYKCKACEYYEKVETDLEGYDPCEECLDEEHRENCRNSGYVKDWMRYAKLQADVENGVYLDDVFREDGS